MDNFQNKKLNVGLFIDTYFPMVDGVINVVDNYARNLQDYCNLTVFAPVGRKPFDDSKLPYKVVRCKKKFPIFFLDYDLPTPAFDKEFKKAIDEANLDIVHIHSPFTIGKLGIKYAKEHNIPVVATLHSQFKKDFKRAVKLAGVANIMMKIVIDTLNKCDECWAVNDGVDKLFRDEYKLKAPIAMQYNATDLVPTEFSKEEIEEFDKKYNIASDDKVFCFVGRMTILKNLPFLIESLKFVKDSGIKFKMLMVGTGTDTKRLKKQVKKLGLENEILFVGRITDTRQKSLVFARSDLFLFPSYYDTDGLVKYEAACFNTPTVSIKDFLTASNLTDGRNAYLSDNSTKNYAEKIIEAVSNPEKYNEISKNCHNDLYRTWKDSALKVFGDYQRLIEQKKKEIGTN
ncbi:MAG: glycosyltransferase [Clostridia bacterium]|nr:glycosyltransferase [Clostridia bacterium]